MITFKTFMSISEEAYVGNIGVMEMVKFYRIATPEQISKMKTLISSKKTEEAWEFMQKVLRVKLK